MAAPTHLPHAAIVWLDHWHALVARRDDGTAAVVDVDRGAATEQDFLDEVTRLTDDCDRLMILGPGSSRATFAETYVHRHGRDLVSVDVEASVSASPSELFDRLRLLEGDEAVRPG